MKKQIPSNQAPNFLLLNLHRLRRSIVARPSTHYAIPSPRGRKFLDFADRVVHDSASDDGHRKHGAQLTFCILNTVKHIAKGESRSQCDSLVWPSMQANVSFGAYDTGPEPPPVSDLPSSQTAQPGLASPATSNYTRHSLKVDCIDLIHYSTDMHYRFFLSRMLQIYPIRLCTLASRALKARSSFYIATRG